MHNAARLGGGSVIPEDRRDAGRRGSRPTDF